MRKFNKNALLDNIKAEMSVRTVLIIVRTVTVLLYPSVKDAKKDTSTVKLMDVLYVLQVLLTVLSV